MTKNAKDAISYFSMVSYSGANTLTGGNLAGAVVAAASYTGGEVNYTLLGVDSTKFKDPSSGLKYRMAATTTAGGSYELAASLEETVVALVIGTFRPRDTSAAYTASNVISTGATSIVLGAADIGKFYVGDTLSAAGG